MLKHRSIIQGRMIFKVVGGGGGGPGGQGGLSKYFDLLCKNALKSATVSDLINTPL